MRLDRLERGGVEKEDTGKHTETMSFIGGLYTHLSGVFDQLQSLAHWRPLEFLLYAHLPLQQQIIQCSLVGFQKGLEQFMEVLGIRGSLHGMRPSQEAIHGGLP